MEIFVTVSKISEYHVELKGPTASADRVHTPGAEAPFSRGRVESAKAKALAYLETKAGKQKR
jgi:hypothetical protein